MLRKPAKRCFAHNYPRLRWRKGLYCAEVVVTFFRFAFRKISLGLACGSRALQNLLYLHNNISLWGPTDRCKNVLRRCCARLVQSGAEPCAAKLSGLGIRNLDLHPHAPSPSLANATDPLSNSAMQWTSVQGRNFGLKITGFASTSCKICWFRLNTWVKNVD